MAVVLDDIQDPEAGLALLSNSPDEETPEQSHRRMGWSMP